MALAQVNTLFLLTAVAGYSLFVSSLSNDGGKATSISGGIAVVFFFVDFLAGTLQGAEAIGRLTLFHYYDPATVVSEGMIDPLDIRGVGRRHRRRAGRRVGGVPAARHHAVGAQWLSFSRRRHS